MNTAENFPMHSTGSSTQLNNSASSSAVNGEMSGLFQMMLNGQLTGVEGEKSGLDELFDRLSGMSGEQLAELMALLGLHPAQSQLQVNSGGAVSNGLAVVESSLQSEILAAFTTLEPPFLPKSGSFRLSEMKEQLGNAVIELLQKADVPLKNALKSVQDSVRKEGLTAGDALLNIMESIKQSVKPQDDKISVSLLGGPFSLHTESKASRKPDTLFSKQGTQIRPELHAILGGSSQPEKQVETLVNKQAQVVIQGVKETVAENNVSTQVIEKGSSGQSDLTVVSPVTPAIRATVAESVESARPVHLHLRAEQFKTDFPATLIKQASLIERGGMSEMRITLVPEGLGEIQVRIQGESGQVALQISADTQYARALIDAGIGTLKQQLESQGVQVNRVEVVPSSSATSANTEQGMFDGQKQQRDAHAHNPRKEQHAESGFTPDEAVLYQEIDGIENGQIDVVA